jgi:hypothetical protein
VNPVPVDRSSWSRLRNTARRSGALKNRHSQLSKPAS